MRKLLFLCICLLNGAMSYSQAVQKNKYVKDCGNKTSVSLRDIQNERIPYYLLDDQQLPSTCLASLKKMIAGYEQEDKKDWNKLSNQYCSYKNNWVEIHPGKCEAGGPPPICVKKHWIRNTSVDTTIWSKLQKEVFDLRERNCKGAVCACWAQEIDNEQSTNIKSYSQRYAPNALFSGKKDKFVLECFAGKCPDGYHCENGNCIEDNLLLKNSLVIWQTNTVVNNVDRVKEIGIEYFLSKTTELYNKLYNDNSAFSIGNKKSAESEDFNVWKDAYNKKLDMIKNQIAVYHELLVEYDAAAGKRMSPDSRGKSLIAADIKGMQSEMVKTFKSFNIAYTEVVNTRAKCTNCCTSVFSAYHKWYCYYFVKILSAHP